MDIINEIIFIKLRKKKIRNRPLVRAIDRLIKDFKSANWNSEQEIYQYRPNADNVHNDGFYFFNIHVHRTRKMAKKPK